jgi:hypothetical protein
LRADLFLEADDDTSGYFYVVVYPEVSKLELRQLDCMSLMISSSGEVYKSRITGLNRITKA